MKKILLLLYLMLSLSTYSQNVIMTNGSIDICEGTFYDSGGEGGSYGNNESLTFTICPDMPGRQTRLDFTLFDLELDEAYMTIYNGPDVTYDIINTYNVFSPGTVIASLVGIGPNGQANPLGCLTIVFTSSGGAGVANTGWSAAISCLEPCQNIQSQIDSTIPAPDTDGIIRICQGDQVEFNGSGTFSVDSTGAAYDWDFENGTFGTGTSVTATFPDEGIYLVNFVITDTNPTGCISTNRSTQFVYVSTTPDFIGTQAVESAICLGEETTIEGVVGPTTVAADCANGGEQTALGDVQNFIFTSTLDLNCFQGQLFTDISQLESICIVMEHSYIGDLEITVISPDGTRVLLHNQSGASLYVGNPIVTDGTGPGEGWEYCFSMSGSTTLSNGPRETSGTPTTGLAVQAGTYLPVGSFDNFLGNQIDGQWSLEIQDHLLADDGTIFSWALNFDESLLASDFTFTPMITSEVWDADLTITNTVGNIITVQPTTVGTYCYTYRVVDDFGCEYQDQVCIEVFPDIGNLNSMSIPPSCDNYADNDGVVQFNLPLLLDDLVLNGRDPLVYEVTYYATQGDADLLMNPLPINYENIANPQILFARVDDIASPNSICYATTDITLEVNMLPDFSLNSNYIFCENLNGSELIGSPLLDTGLAIQDYTFEWRFNGNILAGETGPSYLVSQPGDYSVTATDVITGCQAMSTSAVSSSSPPIVSATVTSVAFSDNNVIEVLAIGSGNYQYSLDNGPWQDSNVFEDVSAGEHVITVMDLNGCGSDTTIIIVMDYPKYFTPNGDGYHDTWNIVGMNSQQNAEIFIYDRYGKLVKQLNPTGNGWNGTFNGYNLPAADYWFTIKYNEPSDGILKEFKAHFTLKR